MTTDILPDNLPDCLSELAADVPHLEEYFGVWAIRPETFQAAVDRVVGMDLRAHVEANTSPAAREAMRDTSYQVLPGGIAVIDLVGPMQKYTSSISGGASTVYARRKLRAAAMSDEVTAIIVRIDSPGGTVAGTQELADDVAAAAKRKTTVAMIEDMGASAAYWTASQASAVWANRTALVGSIGTFAVIHDLSAHAGQLGVKVHVVKAGEHKGDGVPGTAVTESQLAEWQRVVDGLNEHFLKAVAAGRKLPIASVRSMADGRVHVGQDAVSLGLVDRIGGIDQLAAELRKQVRGNAVSSIAATTPHNTESEDSVMSESSTSTPQPASYEDLKACLPGADAAFICEQLERHASIDQAQSAWMEKQSAEIAKLRQESQLAITKAAATPLSTGVEPLESTAVAATDNEDAGSQFEQLVAETMQSRRCSRPAAVKRVAAKHPDLREAWVAQYNEDHRRA